MISKCVTTIAGFDPSSGAGITADLMVFAAHGLFGTSCITALTVQNTKGVRASSHLSGDSLAKTLLCLEEDLPPVGIKIGALGNAQIVGAVSTFLCDVRKRRRVIVVLDPVLASSSGEELLDTPGVTSLRQKLLPQVDWITPNVQELRVLTGEEAQTDQQIAKAVTTLQTMGRELNVIVTGGDALPPVDTLFQHAHQAVFLSGEHIATTSTHGTGCAFSSALLCHLVMGKAPLEAAQAAKAYVVGALKSAIPIGAGRGPINHLWELSKK